MSLPTVVVIGPGKIGRDLLIKLLRSPKVNLIGLIGRNYGTSSEKFSTQYNVPYYGAGLSEYLDHVHDTSIFIDATTAEFHSNHLKLLQPFNPFIVDLTPSGIGSIYSPLASPNIPPKGTSISLVSCGGQTALPLLYELSSCFTHVEYIEVVSSMASLAVGPGTRLNIDEYIHTTQSAIKSLLPCPEVKVILNINPANPPVTMKTTLSMVGEMKYELDKIKSVAYQTQNLVQAYCPGYSIKVPPVFMNDGRLVTMLQVSGAGDYLPTYAGNLDIINSSCVELCEQISSNFF
ncbi:hypothetical protein [Synechococcus sp. MIT S9451]|uniref:hypothetical protein n=1 Tax=Synechococcus sp. MIT S9451 TaxID=3082543 RepID=UPI0039B58328